MDALAREYLARGPPFLGNSDFSSRNTLKEAGARWSRGDQKWKACDVPTMCRLIETGLWLPVGVPPSAALRLPSVAEAETSAAEAEARATAEEEERAFAEQQDARNGAALAKAEQDRIKLADRARRELGVPPNEPTLLEEARAHGVTQDLVFESASWDFLGPRSGISDVHRVLRGVRLGVVSWEDITGGSARLRNSRPRQPKSTGAGATGARGEANKETERRTHVGREPRGRRGAARAAAAETGRGGAEGTT